MNCGWANVFGADCPVEADASKNFQWQIWQPQRRGVNHETNDGKVSCSYSPELVPAYGSQADFFIMLRAAAAANLPHDWRDLMLRRGLKVHAAQKGPTAATRWVDYAAQFETKRLHTGTFAVRERHCLEVAMVGFSPYDHIIELRKWGKRQAQTLTLRKQKVYVFYLMFAAGYKPDAVSHNVASEDIDHFLKHGSFLHGEAYHRGVRLPREGGHMQQLPEGFTEGSDQPVVPLLPTLEDVLEVHDGCAGQYAGKVNFHQTAEWRVKTGLFRGQLRLETMRGKGGCDAVSNVLASTVHNALINEELLDPSTRELVHFMARHKPGPSIEGTNKQGWWATDEYVFVYYDTKLFTPSRVPPADGFDGSSQMHAIYGRSVATEAATIDGPIHVRSVFCPCQPCASHDFSPRACHMCAEYGNYAIEYARRSVLRDPRITRTQALEDFASSLREGQVQAIAAARDERHLEGNVWLVLLLCDPYVALQDEINCTDEIERGWWVVKAKYYEVKQRSPRGYMLQAQERMLVVNHLVRLPKPVEFAPLRQSPRVAENAAVAANPLRILYDREYYAIESSMQNV